MSRREIALQCIDITKGRGLELGPLYSPIVSKDEAKISYVDHFSTEDLKKKYHGHPFPLDDIVLVDHVLEGNSLKDTLNGKKFDYVIASHVIEHIPDIVAWLKDIASILNDGGVLSLVIPDKRYTFDILRNESRPADVIGAYLEGQTRASSAVMYDYISKFRDNIVASEVWSNPYKDYRKKPKNSLKKAYDTCLENLKPNNYVDSHCFVFTPYSFFDIVRTLIEHDLFSYEVAYFKDTPENQLEFYVSLRKTKTDSTGKLKSIPKLAKPPEKFELESEIFKLKAEKFELEKTTVILSSELNKLINSRSWKITRPLRTSSSVVRKRKKIR